MPQSSKRRILAGLLDVVKIFALQVFDGLQFEGFTVVQFPNDDLDFFTPDGLAESHRRSPATRT